MKREFVCSECALDCSDLYNDPRTPPLEVTPCLCNVCLDTIKEERIDHLETELAELKDITSSSEKFKIVARNIHDESKSVDVSNFYDITFDDKIRIQVRDGKIEIRGIDSALIVHPKASNTIQISLE